MPILLAFAIVLVIFSPVLLVIARNELKWARCWREDKRKLAEGTARAFALREQVYRSAENELLPN